MSAVTYALALSLAVLPAGSWAAEIVITPTAVEPAVLKTATSERVNFVNRTGRAVHVGFVKNHGEHQLVQVPTTGLIWAIFHRPGPHPYTVHFYDAAGTTLHGLVEAVEDLQRPRTSGACGLTVMENCLEP